MRKRKWMYVQLPGVYEISCDKCGGQVEWSEFEGMVWCAKCRIDIRGTGGIFDGPIPLEVTKLFGISFNKFYFKDKTYREMKHRGNKLIWVKRKKEGKGEKQSKP